VSLRPDDVTRTARYVLQQVEVVAAEMGIDLPGRQFIGVGSPVYDCEQVSVSFVSAEPGLAGSDSYSAALGPCTPVWSATFEVCVVRCAHEAPPERRGRPVGPPPVEALAADLEAASAAVALIAETAQRVSEGDAGLSTASITAGATEGGLLGVMGEVTCNLLLTGA